MAFLKQGKLKTAGGSAVTVASLKNFVAPDKEMTQSVFKTHFTKKTILEFLEKPSPNYPVIDHGLTFHFKVKPIKYGDSTKLVLSLNSPTNLLEIIIKRDPKFNLIRI